MEKRLLSSKEVARYLSISVRHLRRLRADPALGFPKPIKLSTYVTARCFWPRESVDAWVDSRKPSPQI